MTSIQISILDVKADNGGEQSASALVPPVDVESLQHDGGQNEPSKGESQIHLQTAVLTHSYAPSGISRRGSEGHGWAKCFVLAVVLIAAALALVVLPDWRQQSATEQAVIQVFARPPTSLIEMYRELCKEEAFKAAHPENCTELLSPGIQQTWTALGPVDLQNFISAGKIRFDTSFDVGILTMDGAFYQGQLDQQIEQFGSKLSAEIMSYDAISAHGVGRVLSNYAVEGKDKMQGIWEGQMSNEKPNGYGRLIFGADLWYVGSVKNAQLHGTGQLSEGGKTISGTWEFGRLTSCSSGCENDNITSSPSTAANKTETQLKSIANMKIGQLTTTPTFQSVVRKQTGLERALIKIFESPYHESLDQQPKEQHGKHGSFDLASLLNQQLITLDPSIGVSSFQTAQVYYQGQQPAPGELNETQADGVGRQQGAHGIYEGQFKQGVPDGYGSFVSSSQNTFKGMLADGRPGMWSYTKTTKDVKVVMNRELIAGPGEFVFANSSKVRGLWKDGKLVSTEDEEQQYRVGWTCFSINDAQIKTGQIPVPKAQQQARVVSELEANLETLINDEISDESVSSDVKAKYDSLGALDLKSKISENVVKFNEKLKLGEFQAAGLQYHGQVDAEKFSGFTAAGVGRSTGSWGVHEGEYAAGQPSGFGRVVLDNLSVYQGGFRDGTIHGPGTLSLPGSRRLLSPFSQSSSQQLVIVGTWDSGELVSCSKCDGQPKGYSPHIAIPLAKRVQSTVELKLDALFQNLESMFKKSLWSAVKKSCNDKDDEVCDPMAAFTTLLTFVGGPFDLSEQINNGVITQKQLASITGFSTKTNIVSTSDPKRQGRYKYEGQLLETQGSGVGVYISNSDIYQGQFVAGRPSGQGAWFNIQTKEAYIGSWQNGKFSGKGKYASTPDSDSNKSRDQGAKLEWQASGQWEAGALTNPDSQSSEKASYQPQGPQMRQVGRLQKQTERDVIHELSQEPNNVPDAVKSMWVALNTASIKGFDKLDIKTMIDDDEIKYDATITGYLLNQEDFVWMGQTKNMVGQGLGRSSGQWGMYEGELKDGVAHGWGRFISAQKVVYAGQWVAGVPEGAGTLYAADKKVYSGTFQQGALVRTSTHTHLHPVKVAVVDAAIPKIVRQQTKIELALQQVFAAAPKDPAHWQSLGAFLLGELINTDIYTFDAYGRLQDDQNFALNTTYSPVVSTLNIATKKLQYSGQVTSRKGTEVKNFADGIGRLQSDSALYEGQFSNGKPSGYGRLIFDGKMYEGYFKDGKLNGEGAVRYQDKAESTKNKQGTWVENKLSNSDVVLEIAVFDVFETFPLIQSELKTILTAKPVFSGLPAASSAKYTTLGGLDLYQNILDKQAVVNGVQIKLSLDQSYPVRWFTEGTYIYFGQADGRKAQGLGRFETTEGIFEGQFVDGKLEGFVSFIDKDGNQYKGSVKDGALQGEGTFVKAAGDEISGQWEKGQLQAKVGTRRLAEEAEAGSTGQDGASNKDATKTGGQQDGTARPAAKPAFSYQLPTLPVAEHVQPASELSLIKIFNQSPTTWFGDTQLQAGNADSIWTTLKPFPIADLATLGEQGGGIAVTSSPIYDLNWNRRSEYQVKYNGQLEVSDLTANGVGRYQSADCFYEGQIADGFPHGYGRLIYADQYSYTGSVNKGLPNGQGKVWYTEAYLNSRAGLDSGLAAKYAGHWTNGRYRRGANEFIDLDITSLCGTMAVYFREQDQKAINMLAQSPKDSTMLPATALQTWKALGKYDLNQQIANSKLYFVETPGSQYIKSTSDGMEYYGVWRLWQGGIQAWQIGRLIWSEGIYEGVMLNAENKVGVGRFIGADGLAKVGKFELRPQNQVWFQGTEASDVGGILASAAFNDNKPTLLNLSWPYAGRQASALELQLQALLSSTPQSPSIAAYLSKAYVPYPLQTMLNTATVMPLAPHSQDYHLDPTLKLMRFVNQPQTKDQNWRYTGQVNKDHQAEGYGRLEGSFGIYQGQWSKGVPTGYGQAYSTAASYYIGTFANGKFNGKGKMTLKGDGSKDAPAYSGTWKDGVFQGAGAAAIEKAEKKSAFEINFVTEWKPAQMVEDALKNVLSVKPSDNVLASATIDFWEKQQTQYNSSLLGMITDVDPASTSKLLDINQCNENFKGYILPDGSGIGRVSSVQGLYEGQLQNGLANGYGRLIASASSGSQLIYYGQWKAGQFNGKGTLYKRIDDAFVSLTGLFVKGAFAQSTDSTLDTYTAGDKQKSLLLVQTTPPDAIYVSKVPPSRTEQKLIDLLDEFPISEIFKSDDVKNQNSFISLRKQLISSHCVHLMQLVEQKQLAIDQTAPIGTFNNAYRFYNGQMAPSGTVGQGLGRMVSRTKSTATGKMIVISIYEGMLVNGIANGWGRNINYDPVADEYSSYQGQWKNGAYDGKGEYFGNQEKYTGTFVANKHTIGGALGPATIQSPSVQPAIPRDLQIIKGLNTILASAPTFISTELQDKWKTLAPIDVNNLVSQKSITLDISSTVTATWKSSKANLNGQNLPPSTTEAFAGSGFLRFQTPDLIYEGQVCNFKPCQYGRIIAKDEITIPEKAEIKAAPITKDGTAEAKDDSKAAQDGTVDTSAATPAAPVTKEVIMYYTGSFNTQGQFEGQGTYTQGEDIVTGTWSKGELDVPAKDSKFKKGWKPESTLISDLLIKI